MIIITIKTKSKISDKSNINFFRINIRWNDKKEFIILQEGVKMDDTTVYEKMDERYLRILW